MKALGAIKAFVALRGFFCLRCGKRAPGDRDRDGDGDGDGDGVGEGEKEARAIAGRTMRLGAANAADAMRKRPLAAPKLNQSLV